VRFLPRDGVFAPDEAGRAGSAPVIPKEVLHARLPELVAADVVRFLASGARVEEEGRPARPVRPADVAVLVRSHRQARQVQAALQRAGVPAVLHGATSVFASDEAEQLAAVLAAVLEPSDRLMRAALATDLLGLAAIAELSPDGTAGPGDALALLDGLAARDAGAAWGAAADAAQEAGWDAWASASGGGCRCGAARRPGGTATAVVRRVRCGWCARSSTSCPFRRACSRAPTASAASRTCCTWASCCTPPRWPRGTRPARRSRGCARRSPAATRRGATTRGSCGWRATSRRRRW
jgi:hypothetical protein